MNQPVASIEALAPGTTFEGSLPVVASFDYVELVVDEEHQTIVDCIETQVEQNPRRCALKDDARELTYEELNVAANRVAWSILEERSHGRRRPSPGGVEVHDAVETALIIMSQGIAGMIAALGLLKAGKAYAPVDASDPPQRTLQIMRDFAAELLIVNNETAELARRLAPAGCKVINVDEIEPRTPTVNPGLKISPDSLAYVVYTSGSTGTPKGVMHTHRNLVHDNLVRSRMLKIGPSDRVSLFTSATGQAVSNMYFVLAHGAALFTRNLRREGSGRLACWLKENRITVMIAVPPLFRNLLSEVTGLVDLPHLRLIRLGGDWLFPADVVRFQELFPSGCILINALSSTETGPICAFHVDKTTRLDGPIVPVGLPVGDTEVLILDENGQRVAADQPGVIAVRSRYLSTGYWRRHDLTASAFVTDERDPLTRTYLSADRGCRRSDGLLVFLGRRDFQIKIRGFLVDPEEVETALLRHSSVREAAVSARPSRDGENQLVAYVVAGKQRLTVGELRTHLAQCLPAHMIPSIFVELQQLPRRPNGKVDRKALPTCGINRLELGQPFVAPRSRTEDMLALIWRELLGTEHVGLYDSFFELGGDSLLAAKFIAQLRSNMRIELRLHDLIEAPTIAGILARSEHDVTAALQANGGDAASTHLGGEEATGDRLRSAVDLSISKPRATSQSVDPDAFIEFFRAGAEHMPPIICVGDSRPISFILPRLSADVPLFQLKLDGVHVLPPAYLTLDQTADVYVRAIQKHCRQCRLVVVGFSFGGLLAYRLATELLQRGWTEVGIILLEPAVAFRHQPFPIRLEKQVRVLRERFGLTRRGLFRKFFLTQFAEQQLQQQEDGDSNWNKMLPHFKEIVHTARLSRLLTKGTVPFGKINWSQKDDSLERDSPPFQEGVSPLRQRLVLAGTAYYHSRHGASWTRIAGGEVDQCIYTATNGHQSCWQEPSASQWVASLRLLYERISFTSIARIGGGTD
jgi:amino acid adenylation domain-containing protein